VFKRGGEKLGCRKRAPLPKTEKRENGAGGRRRTACTPPRGLRKSLLKKEPMRLVGEVGSPDDEALSSR